MDGTNEIVQSTKIKCLFLTFYLSYFIFLTKLFCLFKLLEILSLKFKLSKRVIMSQDSTISSS